MHGKAGLLITGDDCLRAAREASEAKTALLYYAAAEAAGIDDPALCRDRDPILDRLGHQELRYLNARCGSWRDAAVLDETGAALNAIHDVPGDFSDTIDGLDPANLMKQREFGQALQMCKFLVQRQRNIPFACFMAGCCVTQTPGEEAEALTWLNMAKRRGYASPYLLNMNTAALLRRAELAWLALDQMQQIERDGLAKPASMAVSLDLLRELLSDLLQPSRERPAVLQALRWLRDAQRAHGEKRRAKPEEPTPASIARRVYEAALAGNLGVAGNLLYSGVASEIIGEVFAILSQPTGSPIAVRRVINLLLSTTLVDGSTLDRAGECARFVDVHDRARLEFLRRWPRSGPGSLAANLDIGRLLAAHLTQSAGGVHVITDDPALYEFLRGIDLPIEVSLSDGEGPPPCIGSTVEIAIALTTTAKHVAPLPLPATTDLLILLAPELPVDTVARFVGTDRPLPTCVEGGRPAGWSLWVARGRQAQRTGSSAWRPAADDVLVGADDEAVTRATQLVANLCDASQTGSPFSYIRLIHAEARFLGIDRDLPKNAVPFRPASFYAMHLGIDPSTLTPQQLRRCQDEFHEICLDADILVTVRRAPGDENVATIADRILQAYPAYEPRWPNEIPSPFQVYLLECGALLRTLADRRVLLIGNPAPRFSELLQDPEYRARFQHIGMPQSPVNIVKSLFVPHREGLAFRSLDDLWKEVAIQPFDVALISASLTGKFLAGRIKKYLGRMALDVGFTMQFLANSPSLVAAADLDAARKRGYRRALPLDVQMAAK